TIDAAFYTDIRLGYDFGLGGGEFQLYASVTNLFDRDPSIAPSGLPFGTTHTNTNLFDVIGRRYTLGASARYRPATGQRKLRGRLAPALLLPTSSADASDEASALLFLLGRISAASPVQSLTSSANLAAARKVARRSARLVSASASQPHCSACQSSSQ